MWYYPSVALVGRLMSVAFFYFAVSRRQSKTLLWSLLTVLLVIVKCVLVVANRSLAVFNRAPVVVSRDLVVVQVRSRTNS